MVQMQIDYAMEMDQLDELKDFREEFIFPDKLRAPDGRSCVYLAGNSLGLQPRSTRRMILEELEDWGDYGVEGHFHARRPWLPYHEFVTAYSARLVGALPSEVVVMNSLTVNLHLMMISFYRPSSDRYQIICEKGAFPSDQYAVASQAALHGLNPADTVIELAPRAGEDTLRPDDIIEAIQRSGPRLALVMLGNVNYLTGQAFDMAAISRAAHAEGALAGFNLAHGAGNLHLHLHDDDVDFAVWCSYKYLNAGPGGIAGCFVHERHANSFDLPRLAGWWGHDKVDRFKMEPEFRPMAGAEGWQLSNPPIFQLAALKASLELFDRAGMAALRAKGDALTGYMEHLLTVDLPEDGRVAPDFLSIITPADKNQRGSQLSIRFKGDGKKLLQAFKDEGVVCDFREPDIIRATPAPMYCSFQDVHRFYEVVKKFAQAEK